MPDIFNYWPGWLALTISGLVGFNYLVQESQKFASFWGGWTRRIHERAAERHKIDLVKGSFAEAVLKAVETARDKWEAEGNEALAALEGQLRTVSAITAQQKETLTDLLFRVRCMTVYVEYEALWHHKLNVMVNTANDDHIPISVLPSHIDYYQFEALYRANPNWRNWDEL